MTLPIRSCALLLFAIVTCSSAYGQLVADISLQTTQEPDDRWRYQYLVENLPESDLTINALVLDVGTGADIQGFEQPESWLPDYDPDEDPFELAWIAVTAESAIPIGGNGTFSFTSPLAPGTIDYFLAHLAPDGSDLGSILDTIDGPLVAPPASVETAHLFYNSSAFDGNGSVVSMDDFPAIAPDKDPLFPGSAASVGNISGYSRGINGIFIDIANLPNEGMGIDATDFTFTIGNDDSPEDWVAAPSPTDIGVFLGEGENGSDRVYVTFADGSITDTWLRITANANDDTGLAEDEDLFFGIAPGDTGANLPPNIIGVDAVDLASIAQNLTPLAEFGTEPITVSSDLNRDRTVDARDFLTVAANVDLNVINLITPQLGTAVASAVPEPSAFVLSGLAFLLSIPFLCRQRLTGP